ncbi:hypothetical protein OROHE_002640 [Orobanche hederae]
MAAYAQKNSESNRAIRKRSLDTIIVPVVIRVLLLGFCYFFLWRRLGRRKRQRRRQLLFFDPTTSLFDHNASVNSKGMKETGKVDVTFFELRTILVATQNFSNINKLGQGGFGPVYKGKLANGQDIAVKRLSITSSGQGVEEFKNEVLLISKLQHRNLVKPLGCCVEENEKTLTHEFMPNKSLDFFIFAAYAQKNSESNGAIRKRSLDTIIVPVVIGVLLLGFCYFFLWRRLGRRKRQRRRQLLFSDPTTSLSDHNASVNSKGMKETGKVDVTFFELRTILAATQNFSNINKLGQGGFGPVYKVKLANGQEIAVKRLSITSSGQGVEEFKNEVLLISKLQHKNLVKPLGCCVEENEKTLTHEFMPNKSLDSFIFEKLRKLGRRKRQRRRQLLFSDPTTSLSDHNASVNSKGMKETGKVDVTFFELRTILAATQNFSNINKLGQGGFGPVYKLANGQEIAVKRLSITSSGQGVEEFKNEVLLISKLQHKNLVKPLGCCVEENEKTLTHEFMPNKSLDFFIFAAYAQKNSESNGAIRKRSLDTIIVPVVIGVLLLGFCYFFLWRRLGRRKRQRRRQLLFFDPTTSLSDHNASVNSKGMKETRKVDVTFFELRTILAATQNFSNINKLGQGGFGPVYKGKLANGQEIAIKRLSITSPGQGVEEFINEVLLMSKLQHRNLVKPLGCCVEENEKTLTHEFMPNKSLDFFIFGTTRVLSGQKSVAK